MRCSGSIPQRTTVSGAASRPYFRTRLLRAGPSPQREVFVLWRPDYVDEVEYPSGPSRLE